MAITPFGLDGPHAGWKATDIVASAMGGLLYLGGMPEHPPSWPGGNQSYMIGSAALAVAASAALMARDRTGRGQRVDVSLQEATAVAARRGWPSVSLIGQSSGAARSLHARAMRT